MRKGFLFPQHQQQQVVDPENMSNLTSASGEAASVSSDNDHHLPQQQLQYFAPPQQATQQPTKKKRNLPGNPDPEAEVIALSPKTLMAKNRFVCTICNKGFQRDQNLQLHRRGHNLPWKLKQKSSMEVRKKVYVCPEAGCVHHEPSRALGDLTGIKKHFSRKHGEKKWKCDKCSKRYAVLSDWKAHSKTCGTREYRCDCGTLFSRRDSFITHRAFCDALAEESAREINHHLPPSDLLLSNSYHQILHQADHDHHKNQNLHASILKEEQQNLSGTAPVSSWMGAGGPGPPSSSMIFSSPRFDHQELIITHQDEDQNLGNPSSMVGPTLVPAYQQAAAHMSATALLQKAAQMGSTMSKNKTATVTIRSHRQNPAHVSADHSFSSRDHSVHALASSGNKAVNSTPFPQDSMVMMMRSHGFEEEDSFGDIFNNPISSTNKRGQDQAQTQNNYHENGNSFSQAFSQTSSRNSGLIGEGLTRDFLGLRPLSHSDILSMAGLDSTAGLDHHHHNHTQKQPWQQQ